MGNWFIDAFFEVFIYFSDVWCDLWEIWLDEPVDYLEGLVIFLMFAPLIFAAIDALYHTVWVNRYHREDLLCVALLILQIPVAFFYGLLIIIHDRQPLISGVKKKLRAFRRSGVLLIERLVWQNAPSAPYFS